MRNNCCIIKLVADVNIYIIRMQFKLDKYLSRISHIVKYVSTSLIVCLFVCLNCFMFVVRSLTQRSSQLSYILQCDIGPYFHYASFL